MNTFLKILRSFKKLAFYVPLIILVVFLSNQAIDFIKLTLEKQIPQVPIRVYNQNPEPVKFTPLAEIDMSQSTAAEGLTPDERMERMLRATVEVNVSLQVSNMQGMGNGSGFIIDNQQCLVLTNEHVTAVDGDIMVRVIDEILPNGDQIARNIEAKIVGLPNRDDDLALLKMESCEGLPWAAIGDSSLLKYGDALYAFGQPYGLGWTLTKGIVSNPNRYWLDFSNGSGYSLIQTDAAINKGNSGGPLFTENGVLVGVNSMINDNSNNLGFARSSNLLTAFLGHMAVYGQVYSRDLGIEVEEVELADGNGVLEVTNIPESSNANRVGIEVGDKIFAVNDEPIIHVMDFKRKLYSDLDGIVTISLLRGDKVMKATMSFAPLPEEPEVETEPEPAS